MSKYFQQAIKLNYLLTHVNGAYVFEPIDKTKNRVIYSYKDDCTEEEAFTQFHDQWLEAEEAWWNKKQQLQMIKEQLEALEENYTEGTLSESMFLTSYEVILEERSKLIPPKPNDCSFVKQAELVLTRLNIHRDPPTLGQRQRKIAELANAESEKLQRRAEEENKQRQLIRGFLKGEIFIDVFKRAYAASLKRTMLLISPDYAEALADKQANFLEAMSPSEKKAYLVTTGAVKAVSRAFIENPQDFNADFSNPAFR